MTVVCYVARVKRATPDDLFARLSALSIETDTVRHAQVFTVEEAKQQRGVLTGTHIKYVSVAPGAVTPLGIINDRDNDVRIVLDKGVLRCDPIQCHPLSIDMTTAIAGDDLMKFIRDCGHTPEIVDLRRQFTDGVVLTSVRDDRSS